MRIEHVGLNVADPATLAAWYVEHLGFRVCRGADTPVPVRFLADESGRVMIEIYRNPSAPVPDYHQMDPLVLHLAFICDDVPATRTRLLAAGATPVGEITRTGAGDELAMLRDPSGLAIQLCKRAQAMVG